MKYRCIKDYDCDYYDEDGELTDGIITIDEGRIFETTDENFTDAEIHLIDYDTGDWLGMPEKVLNEYFEEVEED